MISSRDNWERLVAAALEREHFWQLCHYASSSPSISSTSTDRNSDFSGEILNLGSVSVSPSPSVPLENPSVFRGTLEYISDLMSSGHKHKKTQQQFQTVNLKVRMDCDGCELKVKKALSSLSGVKSVEINRNQQKATVTGYVEASKVLKKAKSTGKKAEIWPYVPYNLVA